MTYNPNPPGESCATCYFGAAIDPDAPIDLTKPRNFACRFDPFRLMIMNNQLVAIQPDVPSTGWCGKFKPKPGNVQ